MTVSFTGTIDGVPFEGGTGEDIAVVIGSNTFIPGFEEQLIGIKVGETRTVKATFPAELSEGRRRREGGLVRGHGEGGRRGGRGHGG